MELSVIIPTHNPHRGRLQRTLAGLKHQTLNPQLWEALVIDNASTEPVGVSEIAPYAPEGTRIVQEPQVGLTAARRRGFLEACGELMVLVDDDNVLAPDYLERTLQLFREHPQVGALGGRSTPEFESPPASWAREFDDLIACRDLGDSPQISSGLLNPTTQRREYPAFAPIGAGMALRAQAVESWMRESERNAHRDRQGTELTSGGDNDIVFVAMENGWDVGYFPSLSLTHLIPTARTQLAYLQRLNRGISKSWVQVLHRHDACPWEPIPRWTVPLRQARAWFAQRAWSSPIASIRWQGICGHFEGLATLDRN